MCSTSREYKPLVSKLQEKIRIVKLPPNSKATILSSRAKHLFFAVLKEEPIQDKYIERSIALYHEKQMGVDDIRKVLEIADEDIYQVIGAICLKIWQDRSKSRKVDLTRLIKYLALDEYMAIRLIEMLLSNDKQPLKMDELIAELYIVPCDALVLLTMIWAELEFEPMARLFEPYLSNPTTIPVTDEDRVKAEKQFQELLTGHLQLYTDQHNQKLDKLEAQANEAIAILTEAFETEARERKEIREGINALNQLVSNIPTYQIETIISDSSEESDNDNKEDDLYVIARDLTTKLPKWLEVELGDVNLGEQVSVQVGKLCFAPITALVNFNRDPRLNVVDINRGYAKCGVQEQISDDQVRVKGILPDLNVHILNGHPVVESIVALDQLAMGDPPIIRCPEGTRVVALCEQAKQMLGQFCVSYFPGTIGVQPLTQNRFEYLIFFDNGIDAYVKPTDIRLMVDQPKDGLGKFQPRLAHTKIPTASELHRSKFIQEYLDLYPDWPLVKLKKTENTQRILAIRNGLHESAFVLDVDRQLALLRFPGHIKTGWPGATMAAKQPGRDCVIIGCNEHTHFDEWIYRGDNSRFPALAHSLNANQMNQQQHQQLTSSSSSNLPLHRTPRKMYSHSHFEMAWPTSNASLGEAIQQMQGLMRRSNKQTARKTARNSLLEIPRPLAIQPDEVSQRTLRDRALSTMVHEEKLPMPKWVHPQNHPAPGQLSNPFLTCSSECLKVVPWTKPDTDRNAYRSQYFAPLLRGWTRSFIAPPKPNDNKKKKEKHGQPCRRVQYIAPCGIRLNTMKQIADYLQATNEQELTIDMFSFEQQLRPNVRIMLENIKMEDYTDGQEAIPITLVNCINEEPAPTMIYRPRRTEIKRKGPHGEILGECIEQSFCAGCTCTDDCTTNENCECRQLTVEAHNRLMKSLQLPKSKHSVIGYYYRQLKDKLINGVYECNSQCKCSKRTCFNRVVQQDLKIPMQLFMTAEKGWGVRTLVDIPEYSFVCTYSGELLDEEVADYIGKKHGDRYLADLDLIDVVEEEKERQGIDLIQDEGFGDDEENEEPIASNSNNNSYRYDVDVMMYDEDEAFGERSEFDEEIIALRRSSIRIRNRQIAKGPKVAPWKKEEIGRYFGKDQLFVIDAARTGNIGKFLNHSCDPNCHVQHCFVDTHDLRLPWCAFFTTKFVKAGDELTWDYGYDVDAMNPSQEEVACKCGSSKCRGRLL